ncbi:DEAD/DEAH box helicase [Gordonia amicalis]|uniref:DEAD/DEAH box helicase n=1 Tax=Gordonia amicalis TaxID=89053 RepID=UPI00200B5632|nr:DEAD/DEAH box helicase [Gordonia amicalis]UPW14570.1 DEAD/DEAH box helicase [Gordonia amicalis]
MKPLRAWQKEALDEWHRRGRRAVVEAVTGSGKTEVGIAATLEAVADGRRVLVVVPSRDLLRQWHSRLIAASSTLRVGRRGDGNQDSFRRFDVLVSTVQSAVMPAAERPPTGSLIVADEVHRYAADSFANVLSDSFDDRLGLTATLERSDDGIERVLLPFLENVISGCTYQRGYDDGILAPVNVALVPVPFSPQERARYENLDEVARTERNNLIFKYGCRAEPFGSYLQDVQLLAKDEFGGDPSVRSARRYLKAFSDRRDLLASISGKDDALATVAPGLERSSRTLVFAETKSAAASAAETLLQEGVAAAPYTSDLSRNDRIALLQSFKDGKLTTLAAPRVLDEGIDVPEADVGIVLAASRTRRQMIQRMGRVIRPKADGRAAVFLIFYAEGSSEDPKLGAHGTFLEQLTDIAQSIETVEVHSVPALLKEWLPEARTSSPTTSDSERDMAVNAAKTVAQNAAVVQQVRSHIRTVVASAVRFERSESLDDILRALVELDPDEAVILIHRFGLDGDDPLDHDSIAARLGRTYDDVVELGDDALGKLRLPQVGESEKASVARLTNGGDAEASTTDPATRKSSEKPDNAAQQGNSESVKVEKLDQLPHQPFGIRRIQLPTKTPRSSQSSYTANKVVVYMECEGGFVPGAVFDTGDWSVILDEPIAGRRRFEDPDEAALAQLRFYGDVERSQADGWSLWKVKESGQPIATLKSGHHEVTA